MDIIYVLVPLSIALLAIAVAIFFWAVKGGHDHKSSGGQDGDSRRLCYGYH